MRDPEVPTCHTHRDVCPLRSDEPVGAHQVSLSLAKKAAAFFSKSRSIRSVRFSRRSLVSSARSSVVRPGRVPASIWPWFTHFRRVSSEIPRSGADGLQAPTGLAIDPDGLLTELGRVGRLRVGHRHPFL